MAALPCCKLTLSTRKPSLPDLCREPKTWGEHLRRQRILRGLRQKDLAVAHGVTTETIHNWECGHSHPEVQYLPKIIAFLGYCPYTPGRTLNERLRVAREAQGLSLRQCAEMVQVDEGTLWKWEKGLRRPNDRLVVVAKVILGLADFGAALDRGRIGRPVTDAEIATIRCLRAEGCTLREIGKRLGVAPMTARKYSW